jgi:hypothetical protein
VLKRANEKSHSLQIKLRVSANIKSLGALFLTTLGQMFGMIVLFALIEKKS